MLSANFIVSPLSGDVLATNFTVTNLTSGTNVSRYIWDPGVRDISQDQFGTVNLATSKLVYNEANPAFTYKLPGVYTITLSATDFDDKISVFSQSITADFAFRDYLRFSQIPEKYSDPGKLTDIPFKLEVLTTNIDKPIIVDLFAANSPSTPEQFIPKKWAFLTPTWKFLDKNFNTVTSLSVEAAPVYKNNVVVAISGTAEFYYVDSMSVGDPTENCPVLITATLQTSGFSNPEDSAVYPYESYANNLTVRTGILWHVNDYVPNVLKVTGNYIDSIYPKQWKDIKIPFLVTCHTDRSLIIPGSDDNLSEVIFSYPKNNALGKTYPLNITLTDVNNNDYTIDESPLFFQSLDNNNYRSGGYVFTTLTLTGTPVFNTSIYAQTTTSTGLTVTNNKFTYPGPFAPNPAVWVSNPNESTLNKITLIPDSGTCSTINFLRNTGTLADGTIKEVIVPKKTDASVFNYEMSGFSGIYGVAVDPRDYSVVAADAELDRIYRISNTGEVLKTFELTALKDYDPRKKLFHTWSWTTESPLLSATNFVFYSPAFNTPYEDNYIASVGGVIQPTENTFIIKYENLFKLLVSPNYPPENVQVDVIQIFQPQLLEEHIEKIQHWTFTNPTPTQTFTLTGNPTLSANPNYYIVVVDGVLQNPQSYTVSNINKTLTFNTAVPQDLTVFIKYLPSINPPANWNFTLTAPTTSLVLSSSNLYRRDDQSNFIVNVGGVLQSPRNYSHNTNKQQLEFNTLLPINTPINIRQISIPEDIYAPAAYTPAYVSLDSEYNIWVSLYNSVSVLKFDPDLNFLFSVAPTGINWNYAWTQVNPEGINYQSSRFGGESVLVNPSADNVDIFYNEFFLKPPVVETDKDDNCWVTYANPLCSMLVKYSKDGQSLLEIPTGNISTPINVAINAENNCWVSNFHGSSYLYTPLSGNLQLYSSTTGQLLSSITGVSRPGHLALDRDNNLWFSHGQDRLGYYNTNTSTLSMWTLSSNGFTVYTIPTGFQVAGFETFDEVENEEDEYIGGLAVDTYNRVWVLDNLRNFAWVISGTPNFLEAPYRSFKVRPIPVLGYYTDVETGGTYTESKEGYYYRSLQATGDWTGNRWYQKYISPTLLTNVLTGVSNNFSINEFINKNQIRKVNESFNTAEYYKSLALPENLKSNPELFDTYLGAIAGTSLLSAYEDIGQVIYERIANFINNHADIDTCNIDQLLSISEQVAVPALDYAAMYPTEIRNMLDLASTPRTKLWGQKDEIPLLPQSIGEKYNTQTDFVTADTKIILRDKLDSTISLILVPPENNQLVFPLSSLSAYGFKQPVLANYIVYKYEPVYNNQYIENIIDWDSPFTTQSPFLSTVSEWYGEEGAIETAFRYLLTKNLFLK